MKALSFFRCIDFGEPTNSLAESYHHPVEGLYLVGDAFLAAGIRGSILSSEALARQLTSSQILA